MFMGMKQEQVLRFMGGKRQIGTVGWVMGALVFLVLYSMSNMYGDRLARGDVDGDNLSEVDTNSRKAGCEQPAFFVHHRFARIDRIT